MKTIEQLREAYLKQLAFYEGRLESMPMTRVNLQKHLYDQCFYHWISIFIRDTILYNLDSNALENVLLMARIKVAGASALSDAELMQEYFVDHYMSSVYNHEPTHSLTFDSFDNEVRNEARKEMVKIIRGIM